MIIIQLHGEYLIIITVRKTDNYYMQNVNQGELYYYINKMFG